MATHARERFGWKFLFAAIISVVMAVAMLPAGGKLVRADEDSGGTRFRFKRAERCLMHRINRARVNHGRRRLEPDKQLAYVARRHARDMASSGGVWHDSTIGWKVTRWRRLAQNTGRGASCASLSRSFMASRTHRNTILGRFKYIGVGVENRDGRLFVQELFESRRNPGNVYNYP